MASSDEQAPAEVINSRARVDRSLPPVSILTQPNPTEYSIDHLLEGEYSQYANDVLYYTDEGLRVLMTGAPSGVAVSHEAVRVGKPITLMVVTGTAERLKSPPVIPHWDLQNPDIICIDRQQQFGNPHRMTNAGQVYRSSWTYKYKLLKPITDATKLPMFTSPAELETSADHYFDPADSMKKELNDASGMTF